MKKFIYVLAVGLCTATSAMSEEKTPQQLLDYSFAENFNPEYLFADVVAFWGGDRPRSSLEEESQERTRISFDLTEPENSPFRYCKFDLVQDRDRWSGGALTTVYSLDLTIPELDHSLARTTQTVNTGFGDSEAHLSRIFLGLAHPSEEYRSFSIKSCVATKNGVSTEMANDDTDCHYSPFVFESRHTHYTRGLRDTIARLQSACTQTAFDNLGEDDRTPAVLFSIDIVGTENPDIDMLQGAVMCISETENRTNFLRNQSSQEFLWNVGNVRPHVFQEISEASLDHLNNGCDTILMSAKEASSLAASRDSLIYLTVSN